MLHRQSHVAGHSSYLLISVMIAACCIDSHMVWCHRAIAGAVRPHLRVRIVIKVLNVSPRPRFSIIAEHRTLHMPSNLVPVVSSYVFSCVVKAFSASTLLVGRQKGRLACNDPSVGVKIPVLACWLWSDWTRCKWFVHASESTGCHHHHLRHLSKTPNVLTFWTGL